MPNYKCGACAKFVSVGESAKCTKCGGHFHHTCAKGYNARNTAKPWACPACTTPPLTKPGTVSTPTESYHDAFIGSSSPNPLAEEIKLLREVMTTVRVELESFRQEVSKLNATIGVINGRVDAVELRVAAIEERLERLDARACDHTHEPAVTSLIDQLQRQLNDREQEYLCNDLKLTGIPEHPGENTAHVVRLVTKKLGVDVDDREFVSVMRKGARWVQTSGGEQMKPRPIIVRLARRAVRDGILRAARVRRGLDTEGILDGPPHRIHVNEHLTRHNGALFYKAREEGRRRNWRYVWTRGGVIFIRRDAGSEAHRVQTDHDLERFFGTGAV